MKKNKLYTANRWNQPAFMPEKNIFDWGGLAAADKKANPWNYADDMDTTQQYMNSKNAFGISKADNPFSKGNLAGGLGAMAKTPIGGALIGGLAGTVGKIGGDLIGGGLSSGAGNAIGSIGSTVGSAVGAVNPVLGAAIGVGSQLIGGLTNRMFGTKVDQAKLNAANEGTDKLRNFTSTATSFDDVRGPDAMAKVLNPYSGGWFSSGKARRKNEALRRERAEAKSWAERGVVNNIDNLVKSQMDDAMANYTAFGGPLDFGDGVLGYGLAMDYLTMKKKEAENKKMAGLTQMPAFMPQQNSFAIGGDIQMNGGDFSTGMVHIDAGLSHEENPYEGVQLGVDGDGVPNLVEEGETVWNDYVFSARIPIDQTAKKIFHISKNREMTYADLSKKLESEIAERPNDPVSRAGFEKQMAMLEEQQERQKKEMEAERAKAAFEALSPEEQSVIMAQVASQAGSTPEQQAMAEQQAQMQQPSPEEAAMMQQQEYNLGQEPQIFAEGGKKNVGDWKDKKQNHWDVFTKLGLKRYIENLKQRLNMAPDDETKDAIRREAMNELNSLQQSYYSHVLPSAGASKYDYDENILKHQQLFDRLYGNTGFYSTDENGNVKNLIAEAINLPNGAATDDKPDHWADGYNGRRTSIRNYGSTEYGDDKYYQDLADEFKELGLVYAPNENWKYGDNELYALSLPKAEPAEQKPQVWDWNSGSWIDKPQEQPVVTPASSPSPAEPETPEEEERRIVPNHRAEWPRYAGLLGPAVGLGMQMAGVGKPDTGAIDAAIAGAGDVTPASWKPLGNYLTYRPLDIWYEQNRMNANARATDRSLINTSGGNRGTAMAGLLANGYNSQIASGNLFRQAQEYNDNLRKQVAEFNRGTDQFNSEQYGATSRFNADAYNQARRANAQLKLHAAAQKADMDAGWYNSLYGNVAGLFKGISDIGRENAQRNQVADMAATGIFGNMNPDTFVANGMLRYETDEERKKRLAKNSKCKGGKMKKRGLTY